MRLFHFRHRWSYSGSTFSDTLRVCEDCLRVEEPTYDFLTPGWRRVAEPTEEAEA